jgi:hypothetical protein
MVRIAGYVHATDAAVLDQRLDALAATVCDNDPRTKDQRRADATGRWRALRPGWPASADHRIAPRQQNVTRRLRR